MPGYGDKIAGDRKSNEPNPVVAPEIFDSILLIRFELCILVQVSSSTDLDIPRYRQIEMCEQGIHTGIDDTGRHGEGVSGAVT